MVVDIPVNNAATIQKSVQSQEVANKTEKYEYHSADGKVSTKTIPAWKKNIVISAIVYDPDPKVRFALIKGIKLKEGDPIPDTNFSINKILEKSIMIKSSDGDEFIINVY